LSYPRHPKAEEIQRALLEMKQYKTIRAELDVGSRAVLSQARRLEMIRLPVTRQEREWLAERRGIDRRLVP
jgi:hypothetical protein